MQKTPIQLLFTYVSDQCRLSFSKHLRLLAGFIMFSFAMKAQTLHLNLSSVSPTCAGYSNGTATVVAYVGVPPFQYNWSNGQHGQTTYGLVAGDYSVTVVAGNDETASGTVTVTQPAPISAITEPIGSICDATGQAVCIVTGGTAPYQYSWSDGTTSNIAGGPMFGSQCVTISDAHGCNTVSCVQLPQPLTVSVHTVDVVCPLWCDGSAEAIISGGSAPYTFLWSNGGMGQVIYPLAPGDYSVLVIDGNGCMASATGTVHEPNPIYFDIQINSNCSGNANANAGAVGGTPPYTFIWDHQFSGPNAMLGQGDHWLHITDANGCQKDTSFQISAGISQVQAFTTPATCSGLDNGAASIAVTGGFWPYAYQWSNGLSSNQDSGLAPGNYQVTVSDQLGCTGTAAFSIGAGYSVSVSATATPPGCNNPAMGTATALPTGGNAPYSYHWNDPLQQSGSTATGLSSGTYAVTASDVNGCSASTTILVPDINAISLDIQSNNASCQNTANGSASVVVNNSPNNPYLFHWNTGDSTASIHNLLPGNYQVTVTDANACSAMASVQIGSNSSIEASFGYSLQGCPDNNSVSVLFTDQSQSSPTGVSGRIWLLNGAFAANTATFTGSLIGTNQIFLVASNAEGCLDSTQLMLDLNTVDINIPNQLSTCLGDTLVIQGINNHANDVLNWSWNPDSAFLSGADSSQAVLVSAVPGTFTFSVEVSNAHGCVLTDSLVVTVQDNLLQVNVDSIEYRQCSGLTVDFINHNFYDGAYTWNFGDPDNPGAGASVQNPSYTYSSPGVYTITLLPVSNCAAPIQFPVTVGPAPLADFSWAQTPCSDTIQVQFTNLSAVPGTITGLDWNFGIYGTSTQTNPDITLAESGVIPAVLTLTFGGGCTISDSAQIDIQVFNPVLPPDTIHACANVPTPLNPNGNPNFTYLWSPDDGKLSDIHAANPTVTSAQNVVYTAQISQGACSMSATVNVVVSDPVQVTAPADITGCESMDSTVIANGSPNASFIWSNQADFSQVLSQQAEMTLSTGSDANYYVRATDLFGCFAMDSMRVTFHGVDADFPVTASVCSGNVLNIDIQNNHPDDTLTMIWTPFDPMLQPVDQSGTFLLQIGNQFGCNVNAAIAVNAVNLGTTLSIEATPDSIYQGDQSQLSATLDPGYHYQWSPEGSLDNSLIYNPIAMPDTTTLYQVTVTDDQGCSGVQSIAVVVLPPPCQEPNIYFPNAFTPNGDGKNEVLRVRGSNIETVYFAIYNRWGEKVFESNSQDASWDGTIKGQKVVPDVYGYYLQVRCIGGENYFKKGNVTVLK